MAYTLNKKIFLGTIIFGVLLIAWSLYLDKHLLPHIPLELGVAIGLIGVIHFLEKNLFIAIKEENQKTVEEISDLVTAEKISQDVTVRSIHIQPTATDRGQRPKILVRITDPKGDYTTKWMVELRSPQGVTWKELAFWPGVGKIFRARFPTQMNRSGTWHVTATRNDAETINATETIQ